MIGGKFPRTGVAVGPQRSMDSDAPEKRARMSTATRPFVLRSPTPAQPLLRVPNRACLSRATQGETYVYRALMKSTEAIGWASSAVLLATIMRQVYTQWKTKSTAGVSHWLFIGQLAASIGYVIYSFLLRNWVFVSSNIALLITAIVGQWLYLHNKSRAKSA
jgi:MtN3 and saliva related transmembrane protein